MPEDIGYEIEELADFIGKDGNAVVAFYGGEPLLKTEKIKKMIDILPAKKFVIQSNGFFIEKMGDYIHKVDAVLLSIDGRKKVTDFYRGKGCYEKVMKALHFLKKNNYEGNIIARMTASCKTDIYADVMHLLKYFPEVHWQLDVIWSNLWNLEEFRKWNEEIYKPGIKKLVKQWIKEIKEGRIMGIVPFMGIMTRILHGGGYLPCEAGFKSFTISTDGKIMACPIAPDFEWNVLGNFKKFRKVLIGEPCKSCEVHSICGGRCLFFYKEKLWGEEGFNEICNTTKFLINELEKYKKICMPLKHKFNYPEYNNTTEIIP